MDIISFIKDPQLINDHSLSLPQETALRAFYGLSLTDDMLDIHRECTQLSEYTGNPYAEVDFVIGRRGGKSDKLASHRSTKARKRPVKQSLVAVKGSGR